MTQPTTEITEKDLRSFGLIFASGIALIFGLFFPWVFEKSWPTWPWVVAVATIVPALAMPSLLSSIYKIWMKIGHVLGWINTRIILGVIFFAVFAPISIILFILRKDPMNRTLDANATSYRIESIKTPRDRMENPF